MSALIFRNLLPFLLIIVLCGLFAQPNGASELPGVEVKNERSISLKVVDVPLNEVLNILAKNVPMDVRGTVASQERVTLQFSNLTLEQALSRIMRGYNYVLVRPDESARILLVVMNKTERAIQSEPASAATAPAAPAAPGSPVAVPAQGAQSRPGTQPPPSGQMPGGGAPINGPPATGEVGQPKSESPSGAPGSGAAASPSALPPGMVPVPGSPPSGAGAVPSGRFTPPRAGNPPSEGADRSAPQPSTPSQPQQLPQQDPEPARVMTPFGERPAEPPDAGPQSPVQAPQQ